jgi:hypothetical protein
VYIHIYIYICRRVVAPQRLFASHLHELLFRSPANRDFVARHAWQPCLFFLAAPLVTPMPLFADALRAPLADVLAAPASSSTSAPPSPRSAVTRGVPLRISCVRIDLPPVQHTPAFLAAAGCELRGVVGG